MLHYIQQLMHFLFGWWHALRSKLPRSEFHKTDAGIYWLTVSGNRQSVDGCVADAFNSALMAWLFDDAHRAERLVMRAGGRRFLKHWAHVVVEPADATAQSGVCHSQRVEYRPMVEVVFTASHVLFAVYEAFNDGDQKTASRFRVYNSRAQRRLQFRYISQHGFNGADSPFVVAGHHYSEYSYYPKSPLAVYCLRHDELPVELQHLAAAHVNTEVPASAH